MDDVEKRLREMKAEVSNLTETILWAETDLWKAVKENTYHTRLNEINLGEIRSLNLDIRKEVFDLNTNLKICFERNHYDLVAIAKRSEANAQLIRGIVVEGNDRLERRLSDISPNEMLRTIAPAESRVTPVAGLAGNSIPPTLLKKVELVMDASAGFLKAWSNPANVGIALAIPILAGLGVLVFGVVKAIEGISKPLENLTAPLAGIGKAIGNIGGGASIKVEQGQEIAGSINNAVNLFAPTFSSIDTSLGEINSNLGLVLEQVGKGPQVQQASIVDFTPLINSIGSAVDRLLFSLPKGEENRVEKRADTTTMTRFESEILTLLSSPLKVSVENAATDHPEENARIFADAVTPLISSQTAMYKMLDSNLRKLSTELAALKEAPRSTDQTRVTKINDTMNTSLSDTTESLILAESQAIREVVTKFREEFTDFKTTWMTNLKSGEGRESRRSTEPTRKSGD
jgi:hypothetical protein